jgi:hypothetical protein
MAVSSPGPPVISEADLATALAGVDDPDICGFNPD